MHIYCYVFFVVRQRDFVLSYNCSVLKQVPPYSMLFEARRNIGASFGDLCASGNTYQYKQRPELKCESLRIIAEGGNLIIFVLTIHEQSRIKITSRQNLEIASPLELIDSKTHDNFVKNQKHEFLLLNAETKIGNRDKKRKVSLG